MTDEDSRFGDIRSILQDTPTIRVWGKLCELLEEWEDEGELEDKIFPYVNELVADWDDRLRVAPAYWVEPLLEGEHVPHFAICRTLDLRCLGIVLEDIELLSESPELKHIHRLNLAYNGLQNEGTCLLMASPMISGLRMLDLAGNSVETDGIQAISESAHLKKLEELDLTGNWVNDAGATYLAESTTLPKLERLILRGNPIHESGALALSCSHYLPDSIKSKWRDR